MIEPKQLRDYIIIPSLKGVSLYSDAAVNLLLGTCAQESAMGKYIAQYPTPIAKGIFQMENATHEDIWDNYLIYRQDTYSAVASYCRSSAGNPEAMIYDLRYAAVMCRIHYKRVPAALPDKDDVLGMAEYWKRHYNTVKGAGSVDEFIENYHRYAEKAAL